MEVDLHEQSTLGKQRECEFSSQEAPEEATWLVLMGRLTQMG